METENLTQQLLMKATSLKGDWFRVK